MHRIRILCASLWVLAWPAAMFAGEPSHAARDFFETRIRPILVERCFECHARGDDSEGNLQLVSREALLRGGDRGPAILPGKPAESLLIAAVRQDPDSELQMPPDGSLTQDEVADLARWIAEGAVWPAGALDAEAAAVAAQRTAAGLWSLQPLADPAVPAVKDASWPAAQIDQFILARLEQAGLTPSPPAEKHALLRRLYFHLIGLPPTIEEIEAFVADDSPDAVARVVETLLASPHYGERWGRHWLDLVRFAESNGSDENMPKDNAYRYRDYVIEAFNADVPYDQFVREQIAGDLLESPRLTADGERLASPLGTGQLFFQEITEFVVDWPKAHAEELENQLDVLGKSLLGMTLACARCHDHKFDPISTEDYYSLAGVLESTTDVQRWIDSPEQKARIERQVDLLVENQRQIDALLAKAEQSAEFIRLQRAEAGRIAAYLLAAREWLAAGPAAADVNLESIAARHGLRPERLQRWCDELAESISRRDRFLRGWARLARASDAVFGYRRQAVASQLHETTRRAAERESGAQLFADFEADDYGDWIVEGPAFRGGPAKPAAQIVSGFRGQRFASSRNGGDSQTGRLLSPPFRVSGPHFAVGFFIAGNGTPRKCCVNFVTHSQVEPLANVMVEPGPASDRFEFRIVQLAPPWKDRDVRIELMDESTEPGGYIAADHFMLLEESVPDPAYFADNRDFGTNRLILDILAAPQASTPQALAEGFQASLTEQLEAWWKQLEAYRSGPPSAEPAPPILAELHAAIDDQERRELLGWLLNDESLLADQRDAEQCLAEEDCQALARLRAERVELERQCPRASLGLVAMDFEPHDTCVQKRGNPHTPGKKVPRGYLRAIVGDDAPRITAGSGRRELAEWIVSADNPLTSRVMVNRIWQHTFGKGLVATPDDFGTRGELPSHPELLDYLARRFIASGWSIKALHRLLLLTSTYQQSSINRPEANEVDADNRLLHRMNAQRIEAECIRDCLLSLAGNLDTTTLGPSVPAPVKEFRTESGLPSEVVVAGPQRRTIYLEVRRGAISRFLTLFDFPQPETCVGCRNTAALPLQALNMLNDPFVVLQARGWAERVMRNSAPDARQIQRLYLSALGRPPSAAETAGALAFLDSQTEHHRALDEQPANARHQAWVDLCHLIINLDEFIYTR